MTQTPSGPNPSASSDEIDLKQVFTVLRRRALPLLAAPLVVGGLTYLVFRQQAPTYESVTSILSTQPMAGSTPLSGASVSAPQLPQGAVEQVIHSRQLVEQMSDVVEDASLPAAQKTALLDDLEEALRGGRVEGLSVRARLDTQQRGVYELRATGPSPEAARQLATAASQALLTWDLNRAREGVSRARQNLQRQLASLGQRLQGLPPGSPERESIVAARGQLLLDLSQATVLEEGAVGSLSLLVEANTPQAPIAPRPARNAALAALLTLFAGIGLALLLDALRRRVRGVTDIINLGLPTLGEMPKVPRAQRNQTVEAATRGGLYEAAGFVRVNLMPLLPETGALVAVTSARPGEGKSTVTATIATSFALADKRVLVIDLDLHRPVQQEFWSFSGRPWVALPGATEPQQTTVAQALTRPNQASALDVGRGVHLLPAGEIGRQVTSLLSHPEFPALLRRWAQAYDVVVIDTPPVLSVADAFVIARHTDGLVLVVEGGATSVPEVQRVVQNASSTQTRLLGVVLNKVSRSEQSYYSYSYAQQG
ncbi:polysaccharide biosynthesis tyrosine autokinase [Deinococcus sp. MIMF12]|uniref:Polysaccharide biosynthesis tyrosine autokinase n=1 Tax=Deinococcus rhizophilus TaxID=3049544 RepID=A0ABT7JH59_9DEIO|nr:polysaccharide biosynthesis tyrosine autokinase [Deinococcus rhizophilus]MDL2343009.1 polysaccharide biosynthesis tyrosine autokinase [Deinococcus rhizophilus]